MKITNKPTIAHELGHAIIADLFDPIYVTSELQLYSTRTEYAAMWPEKRTEKHSSKNVVLSYIAVCDLGGMFGELTYRDKFCPWGCRSDLLSFLAINRKNLSFRTELDNWFYTDTDPLSFRVAVLGGDKKERLHRFWHKYTFETRLPKTAKLFNKFWAIIDKNEFASVVDELHKNRMLKVERDEIRQIIKRITK